MIAIQTKGVAHEALRFFQNEQLKDRLLWKKFVDVYRSRPDADNNGWRGEFWGKMMRGGAMVYAHSQDEALYDILTETVQDMLTVAEPSGRVSTYPLEKEFDAWDLWCRKYVMLGCQYYLEICRDPRLKEQIVAFLSACADYIIRYIGDGPEQKQIVDATRHWLGLNSSSLLEPIVRLYRLTGQQKYLDFATYIVKQGGAKGIPVFRLAFEDKIYPYQYGVAKAYEMMSCFEGLLEYYYATGIEDCKTAVINFAHAVMDSELSVIGCCGITDELFDYTAARQTVRQETVLQETCVTVTWMKLCAKLLALTKDPRFADCMEKSFYNAYLGSLNTEHRLSPYIRRRYMEKLGMDHICDTFLPVDSYSPLLSGNRGVTVGGLQLLPDRSYYGCCASIAPAGVGVFLNSMVTADESGITVNFFEEGVATVKYRDATVRIRQKTAYPIDGSIAITVSTDVPVEFALKIRIPGWTGQQGGYTVYRRVWSQDVITLTYDMPLRTQLPMVWDKTVVYNDRQHRQPVGNIPGPRAVAHDPRDDHYIALMRGPITLACDSRTGKSPDAVFDFAPEGTVCEDRQIAPGIPCLLKMQFEDRQGQSFCLVDYASAGKDWQTQIAAWLRTE